MANNIPAFAPKRGGNVTTTDPSVLGSSPWGTQLPSPYGPGESGIKPPGYIVGYNPATQGTANPLAMQLGDINLNTEGLEKFRGEALRSGPSNWAKLATGQQNLEELQAREKAVKDSRGATAGAASDLAMRGGLTGGARERIARGGANNLLNMEQGVARQGSQNRLQIGVNDEQNRIEQLGMLPGMENQALQPAFQKAQMSTAAQQFDVGQSSQEAQNLNMFTANSYNQQMKAWAAGKQAKATTESAPSCWLISGLSRFVKLPADEAELLTRFKYYMLTEEKKAAKFYIRKCGRLIEKMDAAKFDWTSFAWFNEGLVTLLRAGEFPAAFALFRTTLVNLLIAFWDDCPYEIFDQEVHRRAEMVSKAETTKRPLLMGTEEKLAEKCLQNIGEDRFQPA